MENRKQEYGTSTIELLRKAIRDNRLSLVHIEKLLSKLKIALETLNHLEENNRIFFSLSDDVMFFLDNQLNVKSVSPNVKIILGYNSNELVGRNIQELKILDPKERKEAYNDALHVLKGGKIPPVIYQYITKDGSSKFGEVINTCIMKEGKVVGIIAMGKEITECTR